MGMLVPNSVFVCQKTLFFLQSIEDSEKQNVHKYPLRKVPLVLIFPEEENRGSGKDEKVQ